MIYLYGKTTRSYTSVPWERQAFWHMFRKLLYRDKAPVPILLMAALVGVLFEKAVNGLQALRITALTELGPQTWMLAPVVFVLSALLAMMDTFWHVVTLREGRRFRHSGD